MTAWRNEPFDTVIANVSAGNEKIPNSEFLSEGRYAIVDQGKELVAGYTNDGSLLCRAELPVIVFGDHTRILKYIDFPFCIGADGVKVLRPKVAADTKFLYYHLLQLRIAEAGYDRHFKYLRRASILLPPISEQRRIAEILDKVNALRIKRNAALAKLDTLTHSIFAALFGDPAANPKQWPKQRLGDVVLRITKGESPAWQGFEYQDHGALFVTSENVRLGKLDLTATKFIPLEFNAKLKRSQLRPGDVLVNLVGASIGRSCVFEGQYAQANVNQAVAVVTVNRSALTETYLSGLLTSSHGQQLLLGNRVEGARANISLSDLRDLSISVPPMELQMTYGGVIQAVRRLRQLEGDAVDLLDALFASLQHRAFRGEL